MWYMVKWCIAKNNNNKLICILNVSRRGNVEDIFLSISSTLFGREILEGTGTLRKMYRNFLMMCWSNFSDKYLEKIQKKKKILVAIYNISYFF